MGASDNKYDIWDIEQWEPAQLLCATGVVLQLTGIFTGATVWAAKSFNTRFPKTSRMLKAKMTKAAQRAKQGTKAAGQAVKATAKYTYQKLGRVTVNFVENVNETAKNLGKTIFDALKAIEKDLELTLDLITGTNPQYSLAIVGNAANKAKNVSKPTNVTEEREAIKELFPIGSLGRIPYEEGSIGEGKVYIAEEYVYTPRVDMVSYEEVVDFVQTNLRQYRAVWKGVDNGKTYYFMQIYTTDASDIDTWVIN